MAGDKLYVLTGSSGADGEWEYSDFLTTHSSSRAVEHGFGGTLLLGSTTNTNTNNSNNKSNNNATDATANANTSDPTNGNSNTRVTGGLTRTSSGTSHDSAVDLFFQDHAFDATIVVPPSVASSGATNESEFDLQLAKALALSAQEAAVEKAVYEQIDSARAAPVQGKVVVSDLPLTQESTFTFNTSSSSAGGDGNYSHASSSQEPAGQPVIPSQRQHKLYSLQELQQHKQQQQASDNKTKPHPRVKKVRQEEKEDGEISTSAVSTHGSDDETGPFSFDKPALLHAPQVVHSSVRSSHSEPTSDLCSAPSAEINENTQQSEDPQCFMATSTQESVVVKKGEVHADQEDQETEPQFEVPPVLVAISGPIQAASKEEKKNKPHGEMKAISPAELLQMLGATGSSTCMTPDPYKSNSDNHDAKRGSSSKEPISLENTPVGSPDN